MLGCNVEQEGKVCMLGCSVEQEGGVYAGL